MSPCLRAIKVAPSTPFLLLGVALLAIACGPPQMTCKGKSMSPTIADGERIILSPLIGDVARGDILVFKYPEDTSKKFVQRVIGLPGDAVRSQDGLIWVNDQALNEKYVADANRSHDSWGPVLIKPDSYFVMGDNRNNSSDSRTWGVVKRELVVARVIGK